MKKKITKKDYENYLNSLSEDINPENWIIGGKIRMLYKWKNEYGKALRKFDPIAFNVGFNEYKLRKQYLLTK